MAECLSKYVVSSDGICDTSLGFRTHRRGSHAAPIHGSAETDFSYHPSTCSFRSLYLDNLYLCWLGLQHDPHMSMPLSPDVTLDMFTCGIWSLLLGKSIFCTPFSPCEWAKLCAVEPGEISKPSESSHAAAVMITTHASTWLQNRSQTTSFWSLAS